MEHQADPQPLTVTLNMSLSPVVEETKGESERFNDDRQESEAPFTCVAVMLARDSFPLPATVIGKR